MFALLVYKVKLPAQLSLSLPLKPSFLRFSTSASPVDQFFQHGVSPKQRVAEEQQLKKEIEENNKTGEKPKITEKYPKEISPGRAWKMDELRRKSFEDLHKLWYLCLKEKNILFSEREHLVRGDSQKPFASIANRLRKIKKTQRSLKFVLSERDKQEKLLAKKKVNDERIKEALKKAHLARLKFKEQKEQRQQLSSKQPSDSNQNTI